MNIRLKRALIVGFLGALGLSTLGACGTHSVSTQPDQVALHYSGGPFSSKKYKDFVPPSTKKWFGPGDKEYVYPTGQRSYDATGGEGSEQGPVTSTSKDSVEMSTPLAITFQLKTDEQTLREFHEKVGLKYKAFADAGSDDTSAGWLNMLRFYVGQSLDTTIDRELAAYNWRQAYNDPAIRIKLQDQVNKELPNLIQSKIQGDYFESISAQVQRSVPTNQELKDNIAAAQNQVAGAEAAKAKAEADLKTAQAQILLQQAEAKKKRADISAYGSVDEYNKAQAIEKGINPYQPTYIVSGTAPGK